MVSILSSNLVLFLLPMAPLVLLLGIWTAGAKRIVARKNAAKISEALQEEAREHVVLGQEVAMQSTSQAMRFSFLAGEGAFHINDEDDKGAVCKKVDESEVVACVYDQRVPITFSGDKPTFNEDALAGDVIGEDVFGLKIQAEEGWRAVTKPAEDDGEAGPFVFEVPALAKLPTLTAPDPKAVELLLTVWGMDQYPKALCEGFSAMAKTDFGIEPKQFEMDFRKKIMLELVTHLVERLTQIPVTQIPEGMNVEAFMEPIMNKLVVDPPIFFGRLGGGPLAMATETLSHFMVPFDAVPHIGFSPDTLDQLQASECKVKGIPGSKEVARKSILKFSKKCRCEQRCVRVLTHSEYRRTIKLAGSDDNEVEKAKKLLAVLEEESPEAWKRNMLLVCKDNADAEDVECGRCFCE